MVYLSPNKCWMDTFPQRAISPLTYKKGSSGSSCWLVSFCITIEIIDVTRPAVCRLTVGLAASLSNFPQDSHVRSHAPRMNLICFRRVASSCTSPAEYSSGPSVRNAVLVPAVANPGFKSAPPEGDLSLYSPLRGVSPPLDHSKHALP